MNILHLSASPRRQTSYSARFAATIVERLREQHPHARVQLRDLGAEPLPHVDNLYADALAGKVVEGMATGSIARSDQLIAELEHADTIVLGTPMHNYTVPSVLKAWIDHVLRIFRTFEPTPEGKRGLLRDRPVYIAVASGGLFQGDGPRQPDFLTPYLRAILGTMGIQDLQFFLLQGLVNAQRAEVAWQQALLQLDQHLPMPHAATAAV